MNVKLSQKQKAQIANAVDIYAIMQQVLLRENKLGRAQEHFWVIGLNTQNKVLFIELLALGSQNRAKVSPPEAFRMAIYKLATQVIFVHNHPSQNLEASTSDKNLTDYLYKAGAFLQITVLDHLIISEIGYSSFNDLGLMEQIKNNGAWQLVDTTKAELNNVKAQVELEKAVLKNNLKIAANLKASGMDDATIKKHTGLRLHDIRKL